jgi:ribonuclease VapC
MFVDTSAVVALVAGEPEARELADALAKAERRYSAPHVRLEAAMVLSTKLDVAPSQAVVLFDELLREADIAIVPITDKIGELAVACFEKYGKGRGHPARLNLADCLSYACAKAHGAPLLFKGDDFSQTDVDQGLQR